MGKLIDLKEIQEIEENVQRIKRSQQESAQPNTNEMAAEDLPESRERILCICDEAQESGKVGDGDD